MGITIDFWHDISHWPDICIFGTIFNTLGSQCLLSGQRGSCNWAKKGPKRAKREPKQAKRGPKQANRGPEQAKRDPKRVKRSPARAKWVLANRHMVKMEGWLSGSEGPSN